MLLMSAKPREGRMRKRSERTQFAPELGYYIIVTDAAKTEKYYFEGLRNSLPPDLARKLTIKVHAGIVPGELVSYCLKQVAINPQYAEPWLVIDRDEVAGFDDLIAEAEAAAAAEAEAEASASSAQTSDLSIIGAMAALVAAAGAAFLRRRA